jgi:hypothetical protein
MHDIGATTAVSAASHAPYLELTTTTARTWFLLLSCCAQVVDGVLAVCPALANEQQLVTENLELLHSLAATGQQVKRLVLSTPQLLATPIQAWKDFLAAYGLESSQIWRLLANQPQLLLQGSIFGAGRAIMFLRQLGWSDVEILALVVQHPLHSTVLLVRRGLHALGDQSLGPSMQWGAVVMQWSFVRKFRLCTLCLCLIVLD